MTDPLQLIEKLIHTGIQIVKANPDKGSTLTQINTKNEHSIEMDVILESAFIDIIKASKIKANIYSEEIGLVKLYENPDFLISFDPLDGSTNYKIGYNTLLYGSLFALYSLANPTFSKIVVSGAVEYTSENYWLFDGKHSFDKSGQKIRLKEFEINHSTPIYVDLHYRQKFSRYAEVSKILFIRNEGSTVGNLVRVLSGVAGALAMYKMKPEEVGAIVGLIYGAGGVVIDSQSNDVTKNSFDVNKGYEIIAGTENITKAIASGIEPKGIDY